MADRQEMIQAAAAAASTGTSSHHGHGGGVEVDWWSAAVSCSPDQLPAPAGVGSAAGWLAGQADGNSSRSGNAAASSESPGSNSFATGASSVTFQQESVGVALPQPVAGATFAAADWSHQSYHLDGSGFHGFIMSSSRNDNQGYTNTAPNNNLMMPPEPQDQNHQFLTNLGLELLSSPTSPSAPGSFRSSSLLRSLTEPAAVDKTSLPPSFQQQYQQQTTMNQVPLQFGSHTPFWSPSSSPGFGAAAGLGTTAARQLLLGQPARPASSLAADKSALEGAGDSSSIVAKKVNTDRTPPLKKARTGTPSPLPTFKVRKEKLGDRITALQQLVSPFGKTDTASVLHETIEYIKFLHEQVGSLSAPYLKNRQPVPHLKISRDGSGKAVATKGDLTGRGLCLVPISSTFAVASETPVDFWTPFGAAFR